jgi:acyl-CoA synthetase (AMP-forming)/AMP-acid ligase II
MSASTSLPARDGGLDLIRRLDDHARARPAAPAVRFTDEAELREWSWETLRARTAAAAARLATEATGPTRAILLAGNRPETLAALLGALAAGVEVLPIAPDAPASEWSDLARRAEASLLIEPADAPSNGHAFPGRRLALESLADASGDTPLPSPSRAGSLLLHSSGTQGATKIVHRPAAALDALARNVTRAVGLGPEDTVLVTLPLCHSYAIDFAVLGAVASGSAQEIHDRFLPARAAAALLSGRITVWPAVPLMLDAVSRNAREESARLARTRVISAGSPLPPRVRHRFEAAFGARVAQLYGASEFGAIAYSPPEAEGFDPAAVGRPFEGVTFRVVKPGQSEAREPLAVGSEGEVWVRAPSAMDRYLDAPDRPDAEGYWTTGDLGRLDAHGALHVTGRVKSLIDVGGRQVNPLEVEAVLARHPAVTEAVVVGTAFSDTAARLKAIIVPQPGQSPSSGELRAFAREHLAAHKIPRSFELRSELPRSAAGKVLRQKLADEADEVPR